MKTLFMHSKKINKVEEPAAVYQATPKNEVVAEELHPVLIQMIEIGLKQIELGQTKPHEQVMKRFREKYPLQK